MENLLAVFLSAGFFFGIVTVKEYSFKGNRMEIRSQAADEALKLVLNVVK